MTDAPRPLSPDDLLLWRSFGQLALSPDGARLAFVESWADADANEDRSAIYVVPTDASEPPRRLTYGPNGDGSPAWSPDGSKLAFVSARETAWRGDVYVLDLARGGEPVKVVELPRGVMELAWSPDGTRFALTGRPAYPDDPHRPVDVEAERRARYQQRIVHVDRLHYRRDGNRLADTEQPWLWVAPADGSGDPTALVTGDAPLSSPQWSPDGRITFGWTRDEAHELSWDSQVWAVSPEGGEPEQLSTAPGAVQGWCFDDDGGLVCVAYPQRGFPIGCLHDHLYSGAGADLLPELHENVGKHILADTIDPIASGTTPSAALGTVWFNVSVNGAANLHRLVDGKAELVLGGDRVIGEFVIGPDVIAFQTTAPDEPATLRVCRPDGSDERVLHDPNPWIHDRTLSVNRSIWVDVDGTKAQAWVLFPPGVDGDGPLDELPPGILSMHGGPHGAYGHSFNLLIQMIAAQGITVVFGNPPGSLSYGEHFAQLTHNAWGEADFPFVMAFADEIVERGWADPDRLGVTGGSYGGFLTAWVVGHTDRFRAALAARPPTNLASIHGSSEFGWALMHGCFGAHPWEDPDLYRRLSPITYVADITTPLRLLACTEDYRVPMEQCEQLYIALKTMGRDADMVVFRESHMLVYHGKPWSKVAHARAINDWFGPRLGVAR